MVKHCFLFIVLALSFVTIRAQKEITVIANKSVAEVPATMWGIFFEDINFAADGGLYAELIKNKSFEFYNPMMGWKEIKPAGSNGKTLIINQENRDANNPRFARVNVSESKTEYGISNEGFRGMGIQKDKQYNFSVLARKGSGNVTLNIELVNAKGEKIGSASLKDFSSTWKKNSVSLTSSATDAKARLNIFFIGKGSLDIDLVSLFPKDTWKNRSNGLRPDLVQKLADLKPGFIRFPGGCIVEGHELETRYQWKKTIGAPDSRPMIVNRWNTEIRNRQTPDYFQSFGLGFYEYFQLAEDLGAAPLPILNCGMACQFNTSEVAPMDQLDPYIQDAVDLIEFANAASDTKWGKVRAGMGHPKPFSMKLLGVGNEQWDEQYMERYKQFEKVLKQRYPDVKLIAAAGPDPQGARFDYAWKEFRNSKVDMIDEHYYQSPEWFQKNAARYDNYDRKGPKVFAGEYAVHSKEDKESESRNTWLSALSEAAFMTGLERNADVVQMASYAPLFAHEEAWQWRPDLIWFDNLRSVATPNYYVQQLYSVNKGTNVVQALSDGKALSGKDSIYASAVTNKKTNEVIVKLVNTSTSPVTYQVNLDGVSDAKQEASMTVLSSDQPFIYNTLDKQQNVSPVEKKIAVNNNKIDVVLQPMSFNVIKVSCKF